MTMHSSFDKVRFLWVMAVSVLAVVLSVLAYGSPASANHANDGIIPTANDLSPNNQCVAGLSSNEVCQTDNASVTYYMDSSGEFELETPDPSVVIAAIDNYRDDTDLTVTYDSSPTFSGAGETDIVYQEGDAGFPDSVHGVTWCNDATNGTTWDCDQQYIRIRGNGRITPWTSSHETGHAVGMLHPEEWAPVFGNCSSAIAPMQKFVDCSTSTSDSLSANVVANINHVY